MIIFSSVKTKTHFLIVGFSGYIENKTGKKIMLNFYKVQTKSNKTVVSNKQLLDILINICGGGYTTSQTVKAMHSLHKIDAGKKVRLKYRGEIVIFNKLSLAEVIKDFTAKNGGYKEALKIAITNSIDQVNKNGVITYHFKDTSKISFNDTNQSIKFGV